MGSTFVDGPMRNCAAESQSAFGWLFSPHVIHSKQEIGCGEVLRTSRATQQLKQHTSVR